MPLMPGKKMIGENMNTEENAGKGRKQALAIALSMARKKKMAHGGMASSTCYACGGQVNPKLEESKMASGGMVSEEHEASTPKEGSYAEEWNENKSPDWGGFSKDEEREDEPNKYDTMPQNYAEGGGVDMEFDPTSDDDVDGDSDDLVYSPEEFSDRGFQDKKEDDDEENSKRGNFIRSYMIARKMRG